jgi:hypothetical protein
MTDRELIAIICNGWLSNKYASYRDPKDIAKFAVEIAREIIRLSKEDG